MSHMIEYLPWLILAPTVTIALVWCSFVFGHEKGHAAGIVEWTRVTSKAKQ